MIKNIELTLKKALSKLRVKNKFGFKGKCLAEEDVACIIDGKITEAKRKKILKHTLCCEPCTMKLKDHFAILNAVDKKGLLEVPKNITQQAMDLYSVEVGTNILEVVLNFKDKFIELVRTTGEIARGSVLVPIPILRSKEENTFQKEIKIVKVFNNVLTEVGIERQKAELCDIEIRLTNKETKKKLQGVRASLLKNDKEIESSLVENGKVIFREVAPGEYIIALKKEDVKIGIIQFSINKT